MRVGYLIPSNKRGLKGAPGQSEVTNTSYDPVINMTFSEYESNLKDHAGLSSSVHTAIGAAVLTAIKIGALSNSWNPVGWILGAVATVITLAIKLGVFDSSHSWDGERAKVCYDIMSVHYEKNVLGERTGRLVDGKPEFTGGLTQFFSTTMAHDETAMAMMNKTLIGLAIYKGFFSRVRQANWDEVSTAHTQQLKEIAERMYDNFLGKINNYKSVYSIEFIQKNIKLSDPFFDDYCIELNLFHEKMDKDRILRKDITVTVTLVLLKRKPEAIGWMIPFSDFVDANSSNAHVFEKLYKEESQTHKMALGGRDVIELLKLKGFMTTEEVEIYSGKLDKELKGQPAIFNSLSQKNVPETKVNSSHQVNSVVPNKDTQGQNPVEKPTTQINTGVPNKDTQGQNPVEKPTTQINTDVPNKESQKIIGEENQRSYWWLWLLILGAGGYIIKNIKKQER